MPGTPTASKAASSEKSSHSPSKRTYAHGESYTGELQGRYRHGKGTYYFNDGSWIQGTWENDNLSGNATFYNAKQQRTDQGTFCGTSRKGHGMMTWDNGHIYEGTWDDTEGGLQGKGVMRSADGKKEAGKWRNGSWKRSFSYKNSFYDIIYPIQKHPVSSLVSLLIIIALLILGITIDTKNCISDPYTIYLLTGDSFPSIKNTAFINIAYLLSGMALLIMSMYGPAFRRISGIHYNPLTTIVLSSMSLGGTLGFLHTSYKGEAYYIIITIFSLYLLIFMAKFYYKSVRFEFAIIAGILFSWLSILLFRNSYYLFEGMRWPYALPLLLVLVCFALGRIKYEQNGFFPNHKSFSLAILGILLNFIIIHPCFDLEKILSHLEPLFR